MLTRLGALLALGVGTMLAVMPSQRADGTETTGAGMLESKPLSGDTMRLLLSPQPLSSERFMAYYALAYR